jgi:hypothetical protein
LRDRPPSQRSRHDEDAVTEGWHRLLLWGAAALVAALTAVTFVLWATNGAAYLVDLVQTYCF